MCASLRFAFLVGSGAFLFSLVLISTVVPAMGEAVQPSMFVSAVIGSYSIGSPVAFWLMRQSRRLKAALRSMEGLHRDLAEAHRRLGERARRDAMTGLLNREAFVTSIDASVEGGVLLMADIDTFKTINDRYGHAAGDRAITLVADALGEFAALVGATAAGRLGGEEFGLWVAEPTESAAALAERLCVLVRAIAFEPLPEETRRLTISVGYARAGRDSQAEGLLRLADHRLYAAKQAGRDRVGVLLDARDRTPALALSA